MAHPLSHAPRGLGKRVLLCDVRPHISGNAHDHVDDAGILVHKYGPHIFHTNSAEVSRYLSQFTQWRPYEHRVRAFVDGKHLPLPINVDCDPRIRDGAGSWVLRDALSSASRGLVCYNGRRIDAAVTRRT